MVNCSSYLPVSGPCCLCQEVLPYALTHNFGIVCSPVLLQILLQANKAGTARPGDLADAADCKKQRPPKRPTLRGARGGSSASSTSASSSAESTPGNGPMLSPVWRMSHFLGELHKTTIRNNTGSIALDISGMALGAPLTELLVADNMASGIRLSLPEPKYDNQSIELYDVHVVGNSLSPAAPLVSDGGRFCWPCRLGLSFTSYLVELCCCNQRAASA